MKKNSTIDQVFKKALEKISFSKKTKEVIWQKVDDKLNKKPQDIIKKNEVAFILSGPFNKTAFKKVQAWY